MKIVVTALCGLVGLIVGWIAAAVATLTLGGFLGIGEFEGERSMTAFFGIGPLGGVIGLVAGVWLNLRRPTRSAP